MCVSVGLCVCGVCGECVCVCFFYYKQTTQQISLFQIYRRLLQHILIISYSHLQKAQIYKE